MSSPFVVHGRFRPSVSRSRARERVMRAAEPLLMAILAARGEQHTSFGDIYIYIYTYIHALHYFVYQCACAHVLDEMRARARTHIRTLAPVSAYWRIYHRRVLYNAAIDSRPLFHARDMLQSLQPVSGDSLQCPVSLPVSVHKIYFPRRYIRGGEIRTRSPTAKTENSTRDSPSRIIVRIKRK